MNQGRAVFSDDVSVKVRNRLGAQFGRVRLLVDDGTISTRLLTSWGGTAPRWLGILNVMHYTFRAADCEVELIRGRRLSLVRQAGGGVILRGADSRRHQVELVLSRPRTATIGDVQRELLGAGARSTDT